MFTLEEEEDNLPIGTDPDAQDVRIFTQQPTRNGQ